MKDVIFADVRTAPREIVESSFQREREWILIQAWQLMIDIESANRNRFPDNPIDIDFQGLHENIVRLMQSKEKCPYFEMHEEMREQGIL